MKGLQEYFLKEERPFVAKREIDWRKVQITAGVVLGMMVFLIILVPEKPQETGNFREMIEKGTIAKAQMQEDDPTQEAIKQLQEAQRNTQTVHASLDHLYRADSPSGGGSSSLQSTSQGQGGMILAREGLDSRTQLLAGSTLGIRLETKATVGEAPLPVIGIISHDVDANGFVAIPAGSRVLGKVTFSMDSNEAQVSWQAIILPDGRERPFQASGVIRGRVSSQGIKKAVGQTVTRFVGAYAAGSMNTGAFGENKGGHVNGLRSAVAQTAADRATAYGEELQKEKKTIELATGQATSAVLNAPFSFRDPGGTYGQ